METIFYSERNKNILLTSTRRGNEKAEAAVLLEIGRLEKRIRVLEEALAGAGVIVSDEYAHPHPDVEI